MEIPTPRSPIPSARARSLILSGDVEPGLVVSGHLSFAGEKSLRVLPEGLSVYSLDVSGCSNLAAIPAYLNVRHLNVNRCAKLTSWPADLRVEHLECQESPVRTLPPGLRVRFKLDLQNCLNLESFPDDLEVDTLILRGCVSLKSLPANLRVHNLDVSGCVQLTSLPADLPILAELNVAGCLRLATLPEGLRARRLELAHSGLKGIPESLRGATLTWRGVSIDERIAFRPESYSAAEILDEANAERRRVIIERLGYEAVFKKANATVLDADRDAGGERRLLRMEIPRDEPLVCISVICPSTAHQYVLRVPPNMTTCRQAIAWIAGFNNPDDYDPIVET